MRTLLDVNMLIALLDSDHVSHQRALSWFSESALHGWASCPITQNGCVRIMSAPSYPNHLPAQAVMRRLAEACAHDLHELWPDEVSILDPDAIDSAKIHGPRQLTDIYLLALAVHRKGRLATFDGSIPLAAVKGAQAAHLLVL